jgi:hypothetical protein
VPGAVDFDLRFASNDPALVAPPTQADPSRDVVALFGAGCDTDADLTCACHLVIDPQSLPGGAEYDALLAAQGGSEPFTYAVTDGALPGGVSLDETGQLAGSSTSSGSFSFEVTATDTQSCTARQTYTVEAVCAATASFASIGCRLAVIAGSVNVLPDGKIKRKLGRLLTKAQATLGKAEAKAAEAKLGPARRLLGKSGKALKKFGKQLGTPKVARQIDEATREALRAAAEPVAADVATLRAGL